MKKNKNTNFNCKNGKIILFLNKVCFLRKSKYIFNRAACLQAVMLHNLFADLADVAGVVALQQPLMRLTVFLPVKAAIVSAGIEDCQIMDVGAFPQLCKLF